MVSNTVMGPTAQIPRASSPPWRDRTTVSQELGPDFAPAVRELLGDVDALLDDARAALGPDADAELGRLYALLEVDWLDVQGPRFREPLTLAVAGHTNAGKSTLVNALVGARIAPTAATECTTVITRFRYGPDQPRLVPRTGNPQGLPLTDDLRLPDKLPVNPEDVAHLDVALSFEPLRHLTVIDTPGLSGDEGLASLTEDLLGLAGHDEQSSLRLPGGADVLLFLFGPTLRASERDALRRFRQSSRGCYRFPANAHGVLSRADQLLGEDGPWAAGQAIAAAHAAALKDYVAGVLPVMGKIAETTETGSFNETVAGWLHTIAALSAEDREDILSEPSDFAESEVLTHSARHTLLDRLDLFGIKVLTRPENAAMPAASMHDTLQDLSGIAALRARIKILFERPAAVHRTARVLAGVEKLLSRSKLPETKVEPLIDHIERIRLHDEMHTLAELKALGDLYSGRCHLGEPAQQRALALFERSEPAQRLGVNGSVGRGALADAAKAEAGLWRTYAGGAGSLLARQVAETASLSAYLIAKTLETQ